MEFGNKNHKPKNMKANGDDAAHAEALKKTGHWGKQAAGCMFLARETGKVCLNHRSKEVLEPLTWGTWGGAIDEDEDPKEAVHREVGEEIGKTVKMDLLPLFVFSKPGFKYYNFLAVVDKEFTPKLDWESEGYK
jgi:8-oxo-dGTP pyrophosphatase MutT (NUDIX family)